MTDRPPMPSEEAVRDALIDLRAEARNDRTPPQRAGAGRTSGDLKLVSELLGHSGIQITADSYTTLFAEVDAAAAEAVAAMVPRSYSKGEVKSPSDGLAEPAVRTMCAPEDIPDTKFGHSDLELGL